MQQQRRLMMMNTPIEHKTDQVTHLSYTLRTEAATTWHEFVFHKPSRQVVDEWLAQLEILRAARQPGEPFLMLVDSTVGIVPLTYAFQRGRSFADRFPQRQSSRIALLIDNTFISIVNSFIQMLRSSTEIVRLFRPDQREEAIAWLLAE
ncbi:MAG: STAS/SEC14 domain-containing protein [bacterium]|nr:STAS/SEC14 domain-containing protein [bacterium]